MARMLELGVGVRCRVFRLPYGDQGLLIPKALYEQVGGYRPLALMEDVDIVRRLGRARVHMLAARAITNAERFQREGYIRRSARNLMCLALYRLGVKVETIVKLYEGGGAGR